MDRAADAGKITDDDITIQTLPDTADHSLEDKTDNGQKVGSSVQVNSEQGNGNTITQTIQVIGTETNEEIPSKEKSVVQHVTDISLAKSTPGDNRSVDTVNEFLENEVVLESSISKNVEKTETEDLSDQNTHKSNCQLKDNLEQKNEIEGKDPEEEKVKEKDTEIEKADNFQHATEKVIT